MTTRWLLAKYMGDLRRREPINIGVIVLSDAGAAARFVAESPTGVIDGRSARQMNSLEVYRQWVRHWRSLVNERDDDELLRAAAVRALDENYFLEPGGELVLGGGGIDPDTLLDDLYTALVDETPDPTRESVGMLADRVLGELRPRLPNIIERDSIVEVRVDNKIDELRFDYRYNNGKPHLMQNLNLTFPDKRSWDRLHATAWSFDQVQRASDPEIREAARIALYKPGDNGTVLEKQLGQLERLGVETVNLTREDEARETLSGLLID